MKSNYVQPVLVEIMTVHELASFLKTSDAKLNRLARMGDIPAFRIGKSWLFKKRVIELWIREKTNSCQHELNSQVQLVEKLSQ